ncbi:CocE/NonD family hydrolase [Roseateles sp.]|jgi:putative CocE/NonD family hydrolase|uniref:CocE/NonD family hydrolase n=1 Tax=Roseateles sp. TaxID=1971397 RepID=UPI0037C84E4D
MSKEAGTASKGSKATSSMSVLENAGSNGGPTVEAMPLPNLRVRLPMRDGVQLDTSVWLPSDQGPAPAILFRTPYRQHIMGWRRLGILRYVQSGYAVVFQLIRGIGDSEGTFTFNSPHERLDGFDTVEWIARQTWCDGAVGMDGASYVGMTQLAAAAERPPHLRCIVPCVPSVDFFREIPYMGGIFSRLHSINWTNLLQIDSLAEAKGGFASPGPILSQPEWLQRMRSRPLIDAADGVLTGTRLEHYKDILAHPRFDEWWNQRSLSSADYRNIDLPCLVVSGNFDLCIGALTLWRQMEAHAAHPEQRQLLIGPWDHGQSYVGGGKQYGPYDFGDADRVDPMDLRLAFFDQHLRGKGKAPVLPSRVQLFVTGANQWVGFDEYPPRETTAHTLYLRSDGRANSARGQGWLHREAPTPHEMPDHFIADPTLPFSPALFAADPFQLDLREFERCHDILCYSGAALEQPLTLIGEAGLHLHMAADTPDCDVIAQLAERRSDGQVIRLAFATLRLRYRQGKDKELLLTPGQPVEVKLPFTYIAHQLPAGSSLCLFIGGTLFPLLDPNPNTGEPIATAVEMRCATTTIFHAGQRASSLTLPVLAHAGS